MAQHFENDGKQVNANFGARAGWATTPTPENFLNYFSSKHLPPTPDGRAYLNAVRYNNPKFDQLMAKALATTNAAQAPAIVPTSRATNLRRCHCS